MAYRRSHLTLVMPVPGLMPENKRVGATLRRCRDEQAGVLCYDASIQNSRRDAAFVSRVRLGTRNLRILRMRNLDFSSWQGLLSTVLGLAVITLIGVGIRLLAQQSIQQRRERENRQINERLRTLIAAYKTLGGSFTGNLVVDPTHLGDLRRRGETAAGVEPARAAREDNLPAVAQGGDAARSSDRSRRIRDAVEAALSDIVLLGTEEQVRLAAAAAAELVAGRTVHTHDLVVSLRDFIRRVLDLEPIAPGLSIPRQGPTRMPASRGKGEGGGQGDAKGGGSRGGGGGGGAGIGAGMGFGLGGSLAHDDSAEHRND